MQSRPMAKKHPDERIGPFEESARRIQAHEAPDITVNDAGANPRSRPPQGNKGAGSAPRVAWDAEFCDRCGRLRAGRPSHKDAGSLSPRASEHPQVHRGRVRRPPPLVDYRLKRRPGTGLTSMPRRSSMPPRRATQPSAVGWRPALKAENCSRVRV